MSNKNPSGKPLKPILLESQKKSPELLLSGRIQAHSDGHGFFLNQDGPDFYLPASEMGKAMHGDYVQIQPLGKNHRGRDEGKIITVLEHANPFVVGRLQQVKQQWQLIPEDPRLPNPIIMIKKGRAQAGQVVHAQITKFPTQDELAQAKLVEILGNIEDPEIEIKIATRKFNLPHHFSKSALQATKNLSAEANAEVWKNRVDLRDIALITIDGNDARDFDDAVYCEIIETAQEKKFRLLVAIADVSHFVTPGSSLDEEALLRATSIYFPRQVIPMLPERLCNDLCSLKPGVERLTLVCDIVVRADGEIQAYQFYKAVIHSAARLTYDEVNQALSGAEHSAEAPAYLPQLQKLTCLYDSLLQARKARGAIDFDTQETSIIYDAQGKITQIVPKTRGLAHRLIEECMLAANACAADLFQHHRCPILYRVHEQPSEEKIENLRLLLNAVGLRFNPGKQLKVTDYSALLEKIKDRSDAPLLQMVILRSLQQAIYSPENNGHFGLAYKAYTHFTSPIRRYPDLLIHRAISALLEKKSFNPELPPSLTLNTTSYKPKKTDAQPSKHNPDAAATPLSVWQQLGRHCSANERRAEEATRDVEAWLKCQYMLDKVGQTYSGRITGVTAFGLFIQLENFYVEGLLHVSELKGDYFEFDALRNELRGQRTGVHYRLTDPITVKIARVDLDTRKIDFLPEHPHSKVKDAKQKNCDKK